MHGDAADVGLAHVAHAGRFGRQLDERLAGVGVGVEPLEVQFGVGVDEGHVAGHQLTLVERHQVGHERETQIGVGGIQYRQLLLDLRGVSVARDSIGVDVLVRGDEVGLLAGRAPGPRDPRFGVDDDVLDHAGAGERGEREQGGRRVAAGVGDQVGPGDLLAVSLGEAIDGLSQELRGLVFAVPLLIDRGVVQPEVGAVIDYAHAPFTQSCHQRCGGAVRVGDDRSIDLGVAVEVELLELERHPVLRVEIVQAAPLVATGSQRLQLERGVPVQQPRGQRAREPSGAEYRDARRHGSSPSSLCKTLAIASRCWATSWSVSVRSVAR